ncbi:ubiquitin carboxyl-terminal hydrolase, family 1 [Diaporthe sp. PMI_573]|nr:ubiquitin carboxyl-terminal hydrolase, family 1 [Diaporthaceae sp. PMI_573]
MPTSYAKHFLPLESNPDVFNRLIRCLGTSHDLEFQDVVSLDDPDLLPHPALALILVFPTTDRYEEERAPRDLVGHGSFFASLVGDCSSLLPHERSSYLENSVELERVYKQVAVEGISEVPESAEDEVDYHFVCFVQSHRNGHLYELDGDRKGPIDRGLVLGPGDDMLATGGLSVVREYIEREQGKCTFGLMALVNTGHCP